MNLSLLIHTFNDYKRFWPGSVESVSKCIPDIPKYFGTDAEDHGKFDFKDFKVIYSGRGSWSDRLVQLLRKIPTDYVLYMQEDHWPTQNPPNLAEMMQIMVENDLFRLQIAPITRYYTLKKGQNIAFFDPKSKYLVSHQPSIWRRDFFLKQIRHGENPWINEYEGTKRLNSDPAIKNKIAIYDCEWFDHKCIKGSAVES